MLLMAGGEIHPRRIGKQNGTRHFCLNPSLQHLLRGAVLRLAAPFPSTTGIFCWFHSAATSRKTLLLDEDYGLALNQQRHDSPELGASNGSPRTPGVSSDESWGNGVTNCSVRPLGVGRSHAQPSSTGRCAVGDFRSSERKGACDAHPFLTPGPARAVPGSSLWSVFRSEQEAHTPRGFTFQCYLRLRLSTRTLYF